MKQSRKGGRGRIVILLIGLLFLAYGLMLVSLLFFGISTEARLTCYRRQQGERNEVIPNRYTYHFGYEFTVDGKLFSGTGQRVAGPVYLKPGPGATIRVKYLPGCPFISTDTEYTKEGPRALLILVVAALLLGFSRVGRRASREEDLV
ncbi:MAG: hypothetical protein QM301_10115 [Bacteroidota bacterium]|nr:hypothetical protein [Bacteroidota bacterium]